MYDHTRIASYRHLRVGNIGGEYGYWLLKGNKCYSARGFPSNPILSGSALNTVSDIYKYLDIIYKYPPARLQRRVESIPWNRFLASLKVRPLNRTIHEGNRWRKNYSRRLEISIQKPVVERGGAMGGGHSITSPPPPFFPADPWIFHLKGVWHEIFAFRFFSLINVPRAPEYPIRTISNFFENSRRYSRMNVYQRCQRHRRKKR